MAGTAIGAVGLYSQVQATRDAGSANQRYSNINAELAERRAADAISRGREAEGQVRVDTRRTIGSQRARLAAQGVDVNSGSALDVQADTATLGELDALTVRNNAAREAWGYRVNAADSRLQGVHANASARTQAAGSVLRFGARAYDRYYNPGRTSTKVSDDF